jgi:hypothetical protein
MDNLAENTVHIDLPGQDAKNILVGCANRVILRKHRDIVIDIKLDNHAQYTLKATGKSPRDWFYDPKSKKLISKLDFKDGERCHVWVGRNIQADLQVFCNGKMINQINVRRMDCTHGCGEDPKEKPAPIILLLRSQQPSTASIPAMPHAIATHGVLPRTAKPMPSQDPEEEHIRVLEVPKAAYSELESVAKFVSNGGAPTAVHQDDVLTRNWIMNQVLSVGVTVAQKATIFKELGTVTFYLRKYGNNVYIIFRELPGLRKEFNAARYKTSNIKAVRITAGAGSLREAGKVAWEAPGDALKSKAGSILFLLQITTDVAEWWHDSRTIDPKTGKPVSDIFNLAAKMLTDVAYFWIGAMATSLCEALLVCAAAALSVSVGAAVGFAILGGVFISYGLGWLDNRFHVTDHLANCLRDSCNVLYRHQQNDYHGYGPRMMKIIYGVQ